MVRGREPRVVSLCCHGNLIHAATQKSTEHGRRVRRSDTNIIAVKFNSLTEPSDVHTGDPVQCTNQNCAAILSHFSSVVEQKEGESRKVSCNHARWRQDVECCVCSVQVWACEFCGQENKVEVEAEEVPTKKDTTYLIAPPPVATKPDLGEKGAGAVGGASESSLVIFCVDVSGSMNTMSQVQRS